MTAEQKIIRAKIGLLELPEQLDYVSRTCKMVGARAATAFTASRNSTTKWRTGIAGGQYSAAGRRICIVRLALE